MVIPRVVAEFDHDPNLFTQGLFFHHEDLYESAGLYGKSQVLRRRLNGEILAQWRLEEKFFAEGAVLAGGEVYVLTWREGVVFLLDPLTLKLNRTIFLPQESWGLTFDGEKLWRSDGTERLWPRQLSLAAAGSPVTVTDRGQPVKLLNELEHDPQSGLILANIFGDSRVAFIDPQSGQIQFYLDCQAIVNKLAPKKPEAVLNGLAFDARGQLYLTGKLWPKILQVEWERPR
ncbi:MAG: glutaminyl-peptide cyclotransferase [Deltaproteobacteria bacterium]|jgi:glutamine cyclotransferase|nr:glutaminyl-peptide cyclotransferase [Deltaproteobacteria bacterium]